MPYKYTPANPKTERMIANGFKIEKKGFESLERIPELEALVKAKILNVEEENLEELKAAAEKEKKEAEEARKELERLEKEAEEAKAKAEKEEKESEEASEKVEQLESRAKRRRDKKKTQQDNSTPK